MGARFLTQHLGNSSFEQGREKPEVSNALRTGILNSSQFPLRETANPPTRTHSSRPIHLTHFAPEPLNTPTQSRDLPRNSPPPGWTVSVGWRVPLKKPLETKLPLGHRYSRGGFTHLSLSDYSRTFIKLSSLPDGPVPIAAREFSIPVYVLRAWC